MTDRIALKDVKNGADILLEGAAPNSKAAVKIKVGVVDNGTTIDSKAPVVSLSAIKIGVFGLSAAMASTSVPSTPKIGRPACRAL